LIYSLISSLIVEDTQKFVDALKKANLDVNVNMSDEEIVDTIINNLDKNEKIVKAISFVIAENNGLLGGGDGKGQIDWMKILDSIVLGISPAAKEITQSEATKAATKNKIMTQIETKAAMVGNYQRKIWKNNSGSAVGLVLIFGIVAVGLLGYWIYTRSKNKSAVVPPINTPTPPSPITT
jgi:hypothetical protein